MTDLAARFHALHAGPAPLLLPNAWDAGSARVIAAAGAQAIALTSAGVAWSLGWPDGDMVPADAYLAALARIVRAVDIPVSADIEGGYADDPGTVAAFVQRVADAGAIGINIEDGGRPPALLAAKIAAIRAAVGDGLFVNARTDIWLRGLAPGRELEEAEARAALYREAGASGFFVPGLTELAGITRLAATVAMPLNVMARAPLPGLAALQAAGVRRLSAGSAIAEAVYGQTAVLAERFLAGNVTGLFETALPYGKLNALMR